jgi:hypothetical protein
LEQVVRAEMVQVLVLVEVTLYLAQSLQQEEVEEQIILQQELLAVQAVVVD